MASKGMSMTLTIIVAAVVILVTALVILTIFGTGITPIGSLADAKTQCTLQAKTMCETSGDLPPTWNLNIFKYGDEMVSCSDSRVCGGAPCSYEDKKWKFRCP